MVYRSIIIININIVTFKIFRVCIFLWWSITRDSVYQCIYHLYYFCTELSKYYTREWMYCGNSIGMFLTCIGQRFHKRKIELLYSNCYTLVYVYRGTSRTYTHYARHHVQHGNAKYCGAHDAHHHANVVKGLGHGQEPSADSSFYHMHQCFVVPVWQFWCVR